MVLNLRLERMRRIRAEECIEQKYRVLHEPISGEKAYVLKLIQDSLEN